MNAVKIDVSIICIAAVKCNGRQLYKMMLFHIVSFLVSIQMVVQ